MIRYPAAQLLRLDTRIDRCHNCGGWRFDQHCNLCDHTKKASNYGPSMGAA